jgi:simple sugar transport system permease protein
MLVGAFAAVAVSYLTGSWVLAVGVAMLRGLSWG